MGAKLQTASETDVSLAVKYVSNLVKMFFYPFHQTSAVGTLADTCGGLIGASLVLGLVNKDKAKSMKQMRHIMTKFQERNGAMQCKLLKGVGTKVVLRECPDCVADAAEFLEEQLNG